MNSSVGWMADDLFAPCFSIFVIFSEHNNRFTTVSFQLRFFRTKHTCGVCNLFTLKRKMERHYRPSASCICSERFACRPNLLSGQRANRHGRFQWMFGQENRTDTCRPADLLARQTDSQNRPLSCSYPQYK